MLEVEDLVKTFGDYTAVDRISFQIPDGKIMGLIGRNGTGKTATFRLILDFLTQDQREVLWNGHHLGEKDHGVIDYLPEERGLYPKVAIQDQLLYFAEPRGKSRKEIEPRIDFWIEEFQVRGKKTDKIKSLSRGNQRKVQLITTLIHKPKLIVLDKPFGGSSPVNAELLKDGVLELKKHGSCVISSSHSMDNVEKICDHLIMLRNRKMVLNGKIHEIRESFSRTKLFLESGLNQQKVKEIEGVKKVILHRDNTLEVTLEDPETGKEIFIHTTQFGHIPMFNQQPPTSEEIFRLRTGEIDA